MIRRIEGRNNQSVKLVGKLQKKKQRREKGLFVAEGLDLLEAAVDAGETPVEVLVRDDLVDRLPQELLEDARADDADVGVCDPDLLDRVSALGGSADVVAIFEGREQSLEDLGLSAGICIYLAGAGDPGNVGTIVRSAAAFGAGGVALSPGSADPFSPKALRAGMGAHFIVPVVSDVRASDLLAKIAADEARGLMRPGLVLAEGGATEFLQDVEVAAPVVLVLGEERSGLEAFEGDLREAAGSEELPGVRRIAIRQALFDSLNVAMAASVFLYELTRSTVGTGRHVRS